MSKTLPASCASKVVTVEGVAVPLAEVFSEGNGDSSGVAIIDGDKVFYVTSNASDIKATIEKVVEACEKINSAVTKVGEILTSIGSGMAGSGTAPPPTLSTDVAAVNSTLGELSAIAGQLESMKEVLK